MAKTINTTILFGCFALLFVSTPSTGLAKNKISDDVCTEYYQLKSIHAFVLKAKTEQEKKHLRTAIPISEEKLVGLMKKDVVIGVGSQFSDRRFNEFRSDLLTTYEPGDSVKLTVMRDGKRVQLKGTFPAWHTDEVSVP